MTTSQDRNEVDRVLRLQIEHTRDAAAAIRGVAEAHAQYRPARDHTGDLAWLDHTGEVVWERAGVSIVGGRRLYVRDEPARNLESDPPNPSSARCSECGPGYRVGDDGCRHTPAALAVEVERLRDLVEEQSREKFRAQTELRAEVDAMRPVVEAAQAWQRVPFVSPEILGATDRLVAALATYDTARGD